MQNDVEKLGDSFTTPPKGRVTIWYEDEDGVKKEHQQLRPNTLTNHARRALAHLVYDADEDYKITTFKISDGGHQMTPTEDILIPVEPSSSDTDLANTAKFTKEITQIGYEPDSFHTAIRFTIPVERVEGNADHPDPTVYTEAGLFLSNGDLFARHTFTAILKTNSRRITFEWLLLF